MQSRFLRATLSFVAIVSMPLVLAPAASAEESLRIARPQRTAPAVETLPVASPAPAASSSCCDSSTCGPIAKSGDGLQSGLPSDGLFAHWRAEFVNPTVCPILLCHGSCAGSQMSCKSIKTMIDSLLDAYIPEEPSIQTVLNFRCCAGFTED